MRWTETLARMTVTRNQPESCGSDTPWPTREPRPELEAAMLTLVNPSAPRPGCRRLQADAEALQVARAHSRDMFARGYFSHISPEGRARSTGCARPGALPAAGENLALAPTLRWRTSGLMNSPGHRANILRPAFGRVGIGIVDGGRHGLMVTQTFRN